MVLPQKDTIYMILRPLQKLGGDSPLVPTTNLMRITHPACMKTNFLSKLRFFFFGFPYYPPLDPLKGSVSLISQWEKKSLILIAWTLEMIPLFSPEPHSFCICWRTWRFCPCLSFGPMLLHTLVEFCWFHCCLTNYHLRKRKNCMMLGLLSMDTFLN